jgi:hypothetical protein
LAAIVVHKLMCCDCWSISRTGKQLHSYDASSQMHSECCSELS